MNGAILPFPSAGGVETSRRPSSPGTARNDDFSGAMDDALEAPRTMRRDDDARPARRLEPAKPRESDSRAAAPSRRTAGAGRPAAAKKTDTRAAAADDKPKERADQASSDGVAPTDQAESEKAETAVAGDATASGAEPGADATGAPGAGTPSECAAAADATDEAGDDETGVAGEDSLARGRRWTTAAAARAAATGDATSGGAARHGAGAASAAGAAAAAGKASHAVRDARADAAAVTGPSLTAIATESAAPEDDDSAEAASSSPASSAAETAKATPPTASSADAMTAIENAVAAADAAAGTEPSGADTGGSAAHERPQPKPEAPGAHSSTTTTVAAASPGDGVRFTVASAAGSAAYASAAPRQEEAVLPQIVQSIRLHAVQGTTEARVQLRPEHLGALNITLKVDHNQVTATIQADVAAVRQWIEAHESSLRQALSEQGLHLAKLVVHPDGEQTSKDEQGEDRPRREPRRRSWRDEQATFEVLV